MPLTPLRAAIFDGICVELIEQLRDERSLTSDDLVHISHVRARVAAIDTRDRAEALAEGVTA